MKLIFWNVVSVYFVYIAYSFNNVETFINYEFLINEIYNTNNYYLLIINFLLLNVLNYKL